MEQSQDHEELLLGQEEEEQMEEASAGGRDSSELPVQFLKAVSSMQMKRPDKTTEQESRASPRLQRRFCKPTHFSAFNNDDSKTSVVESKLLGHATLYSVSYRDNR